MKIAGLDDLARKMDELARVVAELDGDIAQVRFNSHDPEIIELAIRQGHIAIDQRVSRYSHNEMVASIASEIKQKYREAIYEKAAASRLEQRNGDDEQ